MNIYAYDTETTGLSKTHDRPLQFAACVYDDNMNLLKETNLRGRLPRYVLPSPDALIVTGQSIKSIQNAPLSHHEFIRAIADDILANSPAIILTYNGIDFDEEILRHCFYANLLSPYITQLNGNSRFDVLLAARAVEACAPGRLSVPRNARGKRSFRLEDLASANGFADHFAHDALGDVQATIHLATIMKDRAPDAWRLIGALRDKQVAGQLMRSGQPIVMVDWDHAGNSPRVRSIMPVTQDFENKNEWLCVDLDANIQQLVSMDAEGLSTAFWSADGRQPILRVKINAMPILFSLKDAEALRLDIRLDASSFEAIRRDDAFAARLRTAAAKRKADLQEASDVWGQLYSGGFFPMDCDKSTVASFHRVSPHEKWDLIPDFIDPRAQAIARWLIGSEWPEVLGTTERRLIEDEFRDHLMKEEAKWTTVPSALERINQLSATASSDQAAILEDYRSYLSQL